MLVTRSGAVRPTVLSALFVIVSVPAASGSSPSHVSTTFADRQAFKAEVNHALNLGASEIIALDLRVSVGEVLELEVPLDGETYALELRPHSIRADGYRLIVQEVGGLYREVEPGPVRTLRGRVLGIEGSGVAASLTEDGLSARIMLPGDEQYWLEPLAVNFGRAAENEYVIYRGADVLPQDGLCGLDLLENPYGDGQGPPTTVGSRNACDGLWCETELAVDADYEYFVGRGSVSAVESQVNAVINAVNIQYERDVDISHVITAIIVRTTSDDPYTTSDAGGLLGEFSWHWANNHADIQRDVAELFTGKDLDGSVIGVAWLSGICSGSGYNVVQSDCCSFSCSTDLSAHELGHNWSADHCSCSNPSYTMNPSLTCANEFHPSFTIPDITAFRDSLDCLAAGGPEDFEPPTPDPMSFSSFPEPYINEVFLTMTAALATDTGWTPVHYQFECMTGGAGCTDSVWQTSRTFIPGGLAPNTAYTYRVRARDNAPVPNSTGYSAPASTATFIEAPEGVGFGMIASDSIEVLATGTLTNLDVASSGVYFDSTVAGGDGGLNAWVQSAGDTATGLSPDTVYSFRVKARNQNGIETEYTVAASQRSLANVAGSPAVSVVTCTELDLDVDANGNPATVAYAIQCVSTSPLDPLWNGRWVSPFASPQPVADWLTDDQWAVLSLTGLNPETEYTFAVTARNQDQVASAAGPSVAVTTSVCGDGDLDDDGDVDVFDFGVWQTCFQVSPVSAACTPGDFAGDGAIDLTDFAEFIDALTGPA